ncbi:MbnP family protein [Tenacibaculum piscium]|uniref:MbnP family protein n=1 Tax=Tenacibaculum piscium TaxID=1458515 RepID=UPI001F43B530|nr:MbnP family protein [Tenacibaculum piscium]
MKYFFLFIISAVFFSCSTDDDELIKHATIKLNFTQNWDETPVTSEDLSRTKFTNKLGTKLTIDSLHYVISKIIFTDAGGDSTIFKTHYLVNLEDSKSLTPSLSEKISEGIYKVSMTFGTALNDIDTKKSDKSDKLNSDYHLIKMSGTYLDSTNVYSKFNYDMIHAFNPKTNKTEESSFSVELGVISIKNDATIEIKMNIAEWFKNPKNWNLNELNTDLTKNYEAQKIMFENGKKGVFSLGAISQ